jgi:2'-5' RNA ligase
VLAIELHDPTGALGRAQASLSDMLASGGWYEPEKRAYLPHVTVARAARELRLARRSLPPLPTLEFKGRHVTLFQSRLSRAGARYEPLASVELSSGGGP